MVFDHFRVARGVKNGWFSNGKMNDFDKNMEKPLDVEKKWKGKTVVDLSLLYKAQME